jgi:putative transposase
MPQSNSVVYIHLVFSTKNRIPFLQDKTLRSETHAFLAGASKTLGCPALIVNGVEDHVHILARFGREINQSEWVKEIKRTSTLWLKKRGKDLADFRWQGGYADFSVSVSKLDEVRNYIARQEQHHKKQSFQDELRALLKKHKVEYDERYLWD